jgi:uncharacterized protein DUF3105
VAKRKKSQVPTPPRGVQAPKRRVDPKQPRDPRRARLALVAVGVVVALVAVGVGIALGVRGGGGGDATKELAAAGCTFHTVPSQVPYKAKGDTGDGRAHFTQLPKEFKYNTFPPSQGPHNPTPLLFGIYDRPVSQFHLVHNLEHGGVAVQYGDKVPEAVVQQIRDWYALDPNGIVVAPLPALGSRIALTAWNENGGSSDIEVYERSVGRIATCPTFDEIAFSAFRDAYRAHAIEPYSLDLLRPGM